MNDRLPLEGVFPMHCSANVDARRPRGRVLRSLRHRQDDALGRPGARADRRRRARLGRSGVFNIEGGCYAKVIRLSADGRARDLQDDAHLRDDPRERRASTRTACSTSTTTRRPRTRAPRTSSSRSATRCRRSRRGTRRSVIFLTADAFGILPPIARLEPRAGAVLLPLRLHREARRDRDRRHRAAADVLDLLRPAVPAPAAMASTRTCSARSSTDTARRSGSSTPGGRAARSAKAAGCRSRRPARCCARRSPASSTTPSCERDPNFGFGVPVADRRASTRNCSIRARRGATLTRTTARRVSSRRCSPRTSRRVSPTSTKRFARPARTLDGAAGSLARRDHHRPRRSSRRATARRSVGRARAGRGDHAAPPRAQRAADALRRGARRRRSAGARHPLRRHQGTR